MVSATTITREAPFLEDFRRRLLQGAFDLTKQAQPGTTPRGIAQYFPRKFGMINGPGGPKEDKIPAMLSDGEFVFTAKAVENAGGPKAMYKMMNKLDPESSKGRGIIS